VNISVTYSFRLDHVSVKWEEDHLRYSERNAGGVMIPLASRTTGGQPAMDKVLVLDVDILGYIGKKGAGEQFDMDFFHLWEGVFLPRWGRRAGEMTERKPQRAGSICGSKRKELRLAPRNDVYRHP
jgi:hypothetical protein